MEYSIITYYILVHFRKSSIHLYNIKVYILAVGIRLIYYLIIVLVVSLVRQLINAKVYGIRGGAVFIQLIILRKLFVSLFVEVAVVKINLIVIYVEWCFDAVYRCQLILILILYLASEHHILRWLEF